MPFYCLKQHCFPESWPLIFDFFITFVFPFYVGPGSKSGSGTGMHSGPDRAKSCEPCDSGPDSTTLWFKPTINSWCEAHLFLLVRRRGEGGHWPLWRLRRREPRGRQLYRGAPGSCPPPQQWRTPAASRSAGSSLKRDHFQTYSNYTSDFDAGLWWPTKTIPTLNTGTRYSGYWTFCTDPGQIWMLRANVCYSFGF